MVLGLIVVALDGGATSSGEVIQQQQPILYSMWFAPVENKGPLEQSIASLVVRDVRQRAELDDSFAASGRLKTASTVALETLMNPSVPQTSSSAVSSSPVDGASGVLLGPGVPLSPFAAMSSGLDGVASLRATPGSPLLASVVWHHMPPFSAAACVVMPVRQRGSPDTEETIGQARHSLTALCNVFWELSGAKPQAAGSKTSLGVFGSSLQPTSSSSSTTTQQQQGGGMKSGGGGGVAGRTPAIARRDVFELRAEEVALLVDFLLPCGRLLILTPTLIKHLRSEVDALLSGKY